MIFKNKSLLALSSIISVSANANFSSIDVSQNSIIKSPTAQRELDTNGSQPYVKFTSDQNESVTLYGSGAKLGKVYNQYTKQESLPQVYTFSQVEASRLVALKTSKEGDEFLHIKFKQGGHDKWYVTQCSQNKPCVSVSDQICRRFAGKGITADGLRQKINQCQDLLSVISLDEASIAEAREMDDYISEARQDYHQKKGKLSTLSNFLTAGSMSPVKNHLLNVRQNTQQILGMFSVCSQWMQNEMSQVFSKSPPSPASPHKESTKETVGARK